MKDDVMLNCLLNNEKLQGDKDIALEAIRNGHHISYMSDELRDDRDVVLAAVDKDVWALSFASDRLKDDENIILEAIKINGTSIRFSSERIKNKFVNNKEIMLEIVKSRGWALKFASEKLKDDEDILLAAITDGEEFDVNSENCKPLALKYTSQRLKEICGDENWVLNLKTWMQYENLNCQLLKENVIKEGKTESKPKI